MGWRFCTAAELLDSRENDSIEFLEESPAIYLWRRHIKPPQSCLGREESFLKWLTDTLIIPNAIIPDSQLNHCAQIREFRVGGGSLTEEKTETLCFFSGNTSRRKNLVKFVESLNKFLPPIYVGQTKNLRQRVSEHLDNKTELADYLKGLGLTANDIGIEFMYLPTLEKPQLELLEMIAQITLSPFGTKRIG